MRERKVMTLALTVALVVTGCHERTSPPAPSKFPPGYAVHGIDVSHHNHVRDWSLVADAGVRFVYVKATEGADLRDESYTRHVTGARAAGLTVGAYHFFTFCRDADEQASNFLAVASVLPGDLPPVVDVEYVGNCRRVPSRDVVRTQLEGWLGAVEKTTGRRPMIYATPEAAADFLEGLPQARWVRRIGTTAPGEAWALWQFDPAGTVPGIDGPVDLEVFRGPLEAVERL